MMHGCAEPSSTLHPYAFAIAPHNITDPIGANASAMITKRASAYQSHGNVLGGIATDRVGGPRVSPPSRTARRTRSALLCASTENASDDLSESSQESFHWCQRDLDRRRVRARAVHLNRPD